MNHARQHRSQRHTPRTAVAVALLLALTACGKGGDTANGAAAAGNATSASGKPTGPALPDGSVPAALVTALDSTTLSRMEQRTGTWSEGDATSTWTAYVTDESVRLIDERATVGESSTRRVMHYYNSGGRLVSHIETRKQTVLAGDRPPALQIVLLSFDLSGDSVTRSLKSVNGETKPIEKFEIDNAKQHADVLLSRALTMTVASPSPKP